MSGRDPRKVSERLIHKGVVDLLRFNAVPSVVWYHVAHERRTTPQEGAFLKRMGVLAGVADFTLLIPCPLGAPFIAFLEIKSADGVLSPAQRAFRESVEKIGCLYAVTRSIDEAKQKLVDWGANGRAVAAK